MINLTVGEIASIVNGQLLGDAKNENELVENFRFTRTPLFYI